MKSARAHTHTHTHVNTFTYNIVLLCMPPLPLEGGLLAQGFLRQRVHPWTKIGCSICRRKGWMCSRFSERVQPLGMNSIGGGGFAKTPPECLHGRRCWRACTGPHPTCRSRRVRGAVALSSNTAILLCVCVLLRAGFCIPHQDDHPSGRNDWDDHPNFCDDHFNFGRHPNHPPDPFQHLVCAGGSPTDQMPAVGYWDDAGVGQANV